MFKNNVVRSSKSIKSGSYRKLIGLLSVAMMLTMSAACTVDVEPAEEELFEEGETGSVEMAIGGSCSASCGDGSSVTVPCEGTCFIQSQTCAFGQETNYGKVWCYDTNEYEYCNPSACCPTPTCAPGQCGTVTNSCGKSRFCGKCHQICTVGICNDGRCCNSTADCFWGQCNMI